jgi:hypothetical protein
MRTILIALMLAASYINVSAQACCCNSSGSNYTILPNLDEHVVGVRYSFASYNATTYPMSSMVMTNGEQMNMMGPGTPTLENMSTIDVFGRFQLAERFQLSVFLPVHVLSERTSGTFQRSAGLGDASVLLQYSVFDPKKCTGKKSKHQLRFGAGIKTPTGKFSTSPDGMYTTDLQMGTGSVDFLFNAIYTYRYKHFGFNVLSSYKKNLVNKEQFRFGDKLREGLNLFYAFDAGKKVTISPTMGLNYDHAFFNVSQKQQLTYTGGDYISCGAGLDLNYKDFTWSSTISPMLVSYLNWSGEPVQRFTFETGLYYSFAKNIIKHKKTN